MSLCDKAFKVDYNDYKPEVVLLEDVHDALVDMLREIYKVETGNSVSLCELQYIFDKAYYGTEKKVSE